MCASVNTLAAIAIDRYVSILERFFLYIKTCYIKDFNNKGNVVFCYAVLTKRVSLNLPEHMTSTLVLSGFVAQSDVLSFVNHYPFVCLFVCFYHCVVYSPSISDFLFTPLVYSFFFFCFYVNLENV